MRRIKLCVYWCCRALGLFHLAAYLTRHHLKILCYHGFAVADETAFRPRLFITPDTFRQRLATLRRYGGQVLPLDTAVTALYAGTLPAGAVVITIDDGFASVRSRAVPLLAEFGYPATVYVTSYYVKHDRPIFRLVVQYLFWKTARRQADFSRVAWTAAGRVDLAEPGVGERLQAECIAFGERAGSEAERGRLCAELSTLLEVPLEPLYRDRRLHLMRPEDLAALPPAGVAVELHTHRHDFPADDRARAVAEIEENRAALTAWCGREPRHFCYPSGLFSEQQWAWLTELNVRSSTTCLPGLNSPATPRHALRRFLDGHTIHPLEFEAALSGFADLARQLLRPGQAGAPPTLPLTGDSR